MASDGNILAIVFGGFCTFFVLFSVLYRKRPTFAIYTIFASFLVGLAVCIGFSIVSFTSRTSIFLVASIYGLLITTYIFAFFLNFDSSLHLKILIEVAKARTTGLTYRKLLGVYNLQIVLAKRLRVLHDSGEIELRNGTYYIRRRFSSLIIREKILILLGKLYGKEGGFSGTLLCILFSALVVRIWGIDFGLPDKHFIDEQHMVYWAFYSASHGLRPPYYLYAPLVPLILLAEFLVYFVGGFMLGVFSTPLAFFISYLSDPTPFFLIGRITMALFGVATVWLVYVFGKTFFNSRIGILASFLLAFTFLHVKESHYLKQDVLLGFFALATYYFIFKILQKGRLNEYIKGGIFFACALGVKYQAILLVPIIYLAHLCSTKKIITRGLILLGISTFLTFGLIHPYFIIAPKFAVIRSFLDVAGTKVVYAEHLQGKSVMWWFLFEHIPGGMGYPLFMVAIVGGIFCLWQARQDKKYFFIPLLPILFFVTIDTFTALHFARYAVILLPFFVLAAAIFIDGVLPTRKQTRVWGLLLVLVVVFPSVARIVQFNTLLTQSDTRTLAREWFEQNVPAHTKVLVESMVKPEYPSSFNVSLFLDEESINKRIGQAQQIREPAQYLRALKQANADKVGYEIVSTTQVGARHDIFTDELTYIKDANYYASANVAYIVLTSWVQEKMNQEFHDSLQRHYRLVQEFKPTYEFDADPHLVRMDYKVLDRVNIFKKGLVFGPVIQIYELKTRPLF